MGRPSPPCPPRPKARTPEEWAETLESVRRIRDDAERHYGRGPDRVNSAMNCTYGGAVGIMIFIGLLMLAS